MSPGRLRAFLASLTSLFPARTLPGTATNAETDVDDSRFQPGEASRLARKRVSRAELEVALLRMAAVVVTVAIYALLFQGTSLPAFEEGLLVGASILYAGGVLLASWQSDGTGVTFGYATAASDAILIATWIYATGGLASPLHVLWYVSIAAVAYRFDLLRVGVASACYVGLHAGVALALGQLPAGGAQLVLHGAYIPLTGGLVALLAHTHADEERTRLEIEAAQSEMERQRIARVEEKWRSILENAPEIVMMVDPEGDIEYCNLVDKEEQAEIQGAPATDWLPARAHDRFEEALDRVIEEGVTESFEIEGRRPGGGIGAYVTRLGPITKDGQVIGASLVSTDVSEQRVAQLELEEHARELERSQEVLAEYARLAAHDLREPLRDISCYAELLEDEADELSAETSEYAAFAIQGAKRLHRLVGAMRELSEVDARQPEIEQLDPAPIVDDAINTVLVERDAPAGEIEVEELAPVQADPEMLRRALTELIDNALTFGGNRPRVRVGTSPTDDGVELWIEDDGPGIPVDYREQVVAAFQRLHNWNEIPGAGTGLAIADRVAVKHGGQLSVEASELGGTRTVLCLPIDEDIGSDTFAGRSSTASQTPRRADA